MPALDNPLHFVLSDEEPVSSRYQTPTSSTFGICGTEIQSREVPDREAVREVDSNPFKYNILGISLLSFRKH